MAKQQRANVHVRVFICPERFEIPFYWRDSLDSRCMKFLVVLFFRTHGYDIIQHVETRFRPPTEMFQCTFPNDSSHSLDTRETYSILITIQS